MDPITVKRTPVLMGRVEFGLLGHYNKYKKSPFETFDVGGDGMTGYSSYATESIALRGYENSSLTPYGSEGYAYTRLGLELRYPLMLETSTSIYALTFVEAGNAWHDVNKFNPVRIETFSWCRCPHLPPDDWYDGYRLGLRFRQNNGFLAIWR